MFKQSFVHDGAEFVDPRYAWRKCNAIDIEPLLQEHYADRRNADGSYMCPNCDQPLTVFTTENVAKCMSDDVSACGQIVTPLKLLAEILGGFNEGQTTRNVAAAFAANFGNMILMGDSEELIEHQKIVYTHGLAAIARGERLVPIAGVHHDETTGTGVCTCCSGQNCDSPGKHSLITGYQQNASTDAAVLRTWVSVYPHMNLGVLMGPDTNQFRIDIDGVDGERSWQTLCASAGIDSMLIETPEYTTGNGRHLCFAWPEYIEVHSTDSIVAPHIDVKGRGAAVPIPPSIHKSGKTYAWIDGRSPDDTPVAPIPGALLEIIRTAKRPPSPTGGPQGEPDFLRGVGQGQRDSSCWGAAYALLRDGGSEDDVRDQLLDGAAKCSPPLSPAIVERKLQSACDYLAKHNNRSKVGAVNSKTTKSPKPTLDQARNVLRSVVEHIDTSPGAIMQDGSLAALEVVRNDDPELWVELKPHFRGNVREIERALKKRGFRVVESGDRVEITVADELGKPGVSLKPPAGCDGLVMPGTYCFDEQGTGIIATTVEGLKRTEVSGHVVFPITGYRDIETGQQRVRITWWTGRRWSSTIVPQAVAYDSHRIVDALASQGLSVGTDSCKMLASYFRRFMDANRGRMVSEKTSSHFGWCGDSLLWGNEQIAPQDAATARIVFDAIDGEGDQTQRSMVQSGTLGEWQDAITPAMEHDVPRAVLYASLAAPLVRVLKTNNAAIHLSSPSSVGKTVAARVAASVWGDPGASSPTAFWRSWNSTLVGFERRAGLLRNLPVIMDETGLARPRDINQSIYQFFQGEGRGRGRKNGGMQDTAHWQTVLISTGEGKITEIGDVRDGAVTRIIELPHCPFGEPSDATRAKLDTMCEAISRHHGHAGPRFAQYIIDHRDDWSTWAENIARERTYATKSRASTTSRAAEAVMLFGLAGYLAHEAGVLPGRFDNPFNRLWDEIAEDIAGSSVAVRSMNSVASWMQQNRARFCSAPGENAGTTEVAGFWKHGDANWLYVDILPTVLDQALREMDINPNEARVAWKQRDWICSEVGRRGTTRRIEHMGQRISVVRILRSGIDAAEGEESVRDTDPWI